MRGPGVLCVDGHLSDEYGRLVGGMDGVPPMIKIEPAVADWLRYCHTYPLDHHPVVWAQHHDIWEDPRGAIGVPFNDPEGVAIIGVLTPFVLIPEVATVILIVDHASESSLSLARVTAVDPQPIIEHWGLPYSTDDHGTITVLPAMEAPVPSELVVPLEVVRTGRKRRVGWGDGWSFEASLGAVADWLGGMQ